jgi:alpha-ketoglutarate-dependent taurine dioxygenase
VATISFEPITANLAAHVRVSADRVASDGISARILDALNQYGVLVFPKIFLSDEQLVALTNQLGHMEAARNTVDGSAASNLGIYRVALDKADKTQREYVDGNDFWHMDGTTYTVPGKATLLKCEHPPATGGDTGFANLYAAYDALPGDRQRQLADMRVIHCLESVGRKLYQNPGAEDLQRWNTIFPPTEHSLLWKQRNGRTSLVIGGTAFDIVGMAHEQGYAFLQELADWCTQDRFVYRHHWQQGDLVIWNNPGLLHCSYPYDEASGRVMHRTTVKGYEEIAA